MIGFTRNMNRNDDRRKDGNHIIQINNPQSSTLYFNDIRCGVSYKLVFWFRRRQGSIIRKIIYLKQDSNKLPILSRILTDNSIEFSKII